MTPPRIQARELRRAAETALGRRGKAMGVIPAANPTSDKNIDVVERMTNADGSTAARDPNIGSYIIELEGEQLPAKTKQLQVKLPGVKVNGSAPIDDDFFKIADAVFWSAPALEKFVLPYYASFVRLDWLQKSVVDTFAKEEVVAMIHLPDSEVDGGEMFTKLATSKIPNLGVVTRTAAGTFSVEPLI